MWDGVIYVDDDHSPIIAEGTVPTRLVVTNAGPSSVVLRGWPTTTPDQSKKADIEIQLWPGNSSSIAANLVRAKIAEGPRLAPAKKFAALGWRVM
jgi:hypothetical protein